MIDILNIIKTAEKAGVSHFGVRVINTEYSDKKYTVGDYLPNSHEWVDGLSTGDELDGVSSIAISYDGFDVDDIEFDLEQLKPYRSLGVQVVLIGGTGSYEGNDIGETVISNATVLHVFQ